MARDFDGSDNKLRVSSSVVSAYPFTMAAFFNSDNAGGTDTIIGIYDISVADVYHRMAVIADELFVISRGGGGEKFNNATAQPLDGVTHHGCAVFTSSTSRTIYIDGGNSASNTDSIAYDSNIDTTTLGVSDDSSPSQFMSGFIAEPAIWNVALSVGEIEALAAGFSPRLIRPSALVFHPDLIRGIFDWKGNAISVTGTTVVAHIDMKYPAPHLGIHVPAAAGAPPTINLVMAPYIPA